MNLNVGIDVAKTKLDYCGLNSDHQILFQAEVPNQPSGVKAIKTAILAANHSQKFDKIIIGMEATSVYNVLPSYEFNQDADLQALDVQVVTLNPKMTSRFSKVYDDEKTDQIDAKNIAEFVLLGRYQIPVPRDEKHLALQRLTRERYHVVKQITDSKNHFLNNLYFKLNTIDTELPTSVFGKAMMSFLTDERYSLDEVATLPLDELVTELNRLSHGRFGNPEAIAKALKRAIQSSYRLDKVVLDSVNEVLGMYANEIRMYQQQLKLLDKHITDLCQTLTEAKCLQSIPGVGPVYSAGIIAEIGQNDRFTKQTKIAKYAGLAWPRHQSGNTERQATPRTQTGDQYLRYYLIEAANSIRLHDPVFAQYYKKKYQEVPKYQHKRASVLTARKLVRVIFTLLKEHKLYQPAKMV